MQDCMISRTYPQPPVLLPVPGLFIPSLPENHRLFHIPTVNAAFTSIIFEIYLKYYLRGVPNTETGFFIHVTLQYFEASRSQHQWLKKIGNPGID